MFFGMVFWITVCLCESCQARYREESGEAMPRLLNEQPCELHSRVQDLRPDVFRCRFEGEERGRITYVRPASERTRCAMAPERSVGHWIDGRGRTGAVRVSAHATAEVLAGLTLAFGYPDTGRVGGGDWASIHSAPPWTPAPHPTLLSHRFGDGRCVEFA